MASGEISGLPQGDIDEYLSSLLSSPKFGPQVVWVEDIMGWECRFLKRWLIMVIGGVFFGG